MLGLVNKYCSHVLNCVCWYYTGCQSHCILVCNLFLCILYYLNLCYSSRLLNRQAKNERIKLIAYLSGVYCYSILLSVYYACLRIRHCHWRHHVRSVLWSDLVSMISHYSAWTISMKLTTDDLVRCWRSKVKVTSGRWRWVANVYMLALDWSV